MTLWASTLESQRPLQPMGTRWYPKPTPTFSDALAAVRAELWHAETFAISRSGREPGKVDAALLDRLLLVACRPP